MIVDRGHPDRHVHRQRRHRQARRGALQPEPDQPDPRARRQGPDDRPRGRRPRAGRPRRRLDGLHELRPELRLGRAGLRRAEGRRGLHGPRRRAGPAGQGRRSPRSGRRHGADGHGRPASRLVEEHIADARAKGAGIPGRRRPRRPAWPAISSSRRSSPASTTRWLCMTEETFGPTLPIMAFDGDEAGRGPGQRQRLRADGLGLDARPEAGRLVRRAPRGRLGHRQRSHVFLLSSPGPSGAASSRPAWGGRTVLTACHELVNIKYVGMDFFRKKAQTWWFPYDRQPLRDHGEGDRDLPRRAAPGEDAGPPGAAEGVAPDPGHRAPAELRPGPAEDPEEMKTRRRGSSA
ncbi:MAG: hypothetical protein MZW92_61935 [Comamonadaceae bacterium]|nr:hypothetical protein [Comamonadaceae bacterium]